MREDHEREMWAPVIALRAELDQQVPRMRAAGKPAEEIAAFVADAERDAAFRVWQVWSPFYAGPQGFLLGTPGELIRLFVDLMGGNPREAAEAVIGWSATDKGRWS